MAAQRQARMRVLLLPSWYATPERPTLGTFFRDQAAALSRHGVDVAVAFVEPRSLRRLRFRALAESHFQVSETLEDGVPTLRLHGWNPLAQTAVGGLVWARLTARLAGRYVRLHGRPDLIHAHGALWAGHAAVLAARRHGVPFVVTEHSSAFAGASLGRMSGSRARGVFRAARCTIAVSEALGRHLRRYGANPVVVPNTIDPAYWTAPAAPRAEAPFEFCCIANLIPGKGIDVLLRAFAAAFPDEAGVRLRIGGGGPLRGELDALSRRLGIAARVELLGPLSREAVREAMWRARALVHPSLGETFGVVLVEAMATGLPVVATRCGGPEEIVGDDDGLLVAPGDSEALAAALRAVRGRPFDAAAIRRRTVARFGYDAIAARMLALYEQAREP